uniref:Tpd52 like 2a n=1 Tax=Oncorhynchus mykiss TaxID=8022 RepID=A0A8K9XQ72_ONCMY
GLSEEDEFDLKMELAKTEDEIQTLRQVLLAKEKYAMDIRRQLGTGPFSEIKQNLSKGWQEVQTSNAYKRTQESISNAGQMTSAALSTVGVAITRRLGDMRYPQLILLHTLLFFPSSFTTTITHLSTSSKRIHRSEQENTFPRVLQAKPKIQNVTLGGGRFYNCLQKIEHCLQA